MTELNGFKQYKIIDENWLRVNKYHLLIQSELEKKLRFIEIPEYNMLSQVGISNKDDGFYYHFYDRSVKDKKNKDAPITEIHTLFFNTENDSIYFRDSLDVLYYVLTELLGSKTKLPELEYIGDF